MRRLLGLGALVTGLAYFFHPTHGLERRRRARAWVLGGFNRVREREPEIESAAVGYVTADPPVAPEPVTASEPVAPAAVPDPLPEVPTMVAASAAAAPEGEAPSLVDQPERPTPVVIAEPVQPTAPTPLTEWVEHDDEARAEITNGRTPSRTVLSAAIVTAVAAAALAAGLVAWTLWPSDSSESDRVALASAQALADDQARAIEILSNPSKRVPVAGAKGRLVLVFGAKGQAALIVSGVEPAPAGKTYEAWVIAGKKPKPAGLFGGGGGHVVIPLTKPVPKGALVAVTLEPAGGVPSPTSTPLFAVKRA
ncbi:MAG: anti-sigma factor [Actinobacteria bacterium]|nr:anti-sigma factor [Actinomycetota bacterium]